MRHVAFFRNLNLGQGWSPTREQLVGAFERAGAGEVENVQVNGTVAFASRAPVRTLRAVLADVRGLTGYADLGVVRTAPWCVALADRIGTLGLQEDEAGEVALYDAPPGFSLDVPWTTPGGGLRVVEADRRHAVTGWRRTPGRGANATPVLEGLTGVKVTSRGTPTMLRLAQRLQRSPGPR